MLEVAVPESFPLFPESFPYAYERLQADPSLLHWWTYLFVHAVDKTLIGSGGFVGKPDEAGTG